MLNRRGFTPSSGSQTVGHGSVVDSPVEAGVVDVKSLPFNDVTMMSSSMSSFDVCSNVVVKFKVSFDIKIVDTVAHNDLDTNFVSSSKNLGTLYRITNTATGIRNIHAFGLYLITKSGKKLSWMNPT